MKTKHLFPIICIVLLFASTCKKPEKEEYVAPKIYTIQPNETTTTKAVLRAKFVKGSDNIVVFGFEWKKTTDSTYKKTTVQANNENYSFTATDLEEDTEYIVKAFIIDVFDTVWYGKEIYFFTKGTVTDIDGNTYLTLRYGSEVWMTENLRVTHFADGTPIEGRSSGKNDDSDGPVYFHNKNHTPCLSDPNFGLLYNWAAAAKADDCETLFQINPFYPKYHQGICPDGWHLPYEWRDLIDSYGGIEKAADMMKTSNWTDTPYAVSNFSQFSIEPAGFYYWSISGSVESDFNGLYESAFFWTLSQNILSDGYSAYAYQIVSKFSKVYPISMRKCAGYSVRCVKD